ncbi:MAG: aspartate carbamoyltransferase regulatory subunit [Eubacterium sp.]|nr:aspartate carbamoyltransferase regulatory subunit [Eubacterium sp.]
MHIDSIQNGIVLDHIKAGKSMQIYNDLGLEDMDCSVAIIKNAPSNKMGRKDIIKIDDTMDLNLDVLGYIDPNITVCYISDGHIVRKEHLKLPKKIVNIIKCKNPRCITSVESSLDHIFLLADEEKQIYRCAYCESKKSEY